MIRRQGKVYRVVQPGYASAYDQLMQSGLYSQLTTAGQLLPHAELPVPETYAGAYRFLEPEQLTAISYPYEWCFSQLKDAALLTLDIAVQSLASGLTLKDATPFNIQFRNGQPVFIDTLSFDHYHPEAPWVAYHQFCQTFLAPLLLCCYSDADSARLLTVHTEGIPLQMAARVIPFRKRFNVHMMMHVIVPSKVKGGGKSNSQYQAAFSETKFRQLLESLRTLVKGLELPVHKSTWNHYYEEDTTSAYLQHKAAIIAGWLQQLKPAVVADWGCNTGHFSRLAAQQGAMVWAIDSDTYCIDKLYRELKPAQLPISVVSASITTPSPAIGWENAEREPLLERTPSNVAMALALVHHLAISNNLPFDFIARMFAAQAPQLIIEFVPDTDEKCVQLLQQRTRSYPEYTQEQFEAAFARYFDLTDRQPIQGSGRILYLMKKK
jgi:aromatic ring-cleaving dioxygenase